MSLVKRALNRSGKAFSFGGSFSLKKKSNGNRSRSSSGGGAVSMTIAMTGLAELDRELAAIASDIGAKALNTEMRRATRDAMKQIVFPKVMAAIPQDTGFLKSQVRVRAIKRSRSKMGHRVGFKDKLFTGDTFYAGFLEYGFIHRGGTVVYGDSFLRSPLYQSEQQIRSFVVGRLKRWVRERNK